MIITQQTIGDLTIGTLYTIKNAVLQHLQQFMKVTSVTNGIASISEYTDSTGTTLLLSYTLPTYITVFVIDITK